MSKPELLTAADAASLLMGVSLKSPIGKRLAALSGGDAVTVPATVDHHLEHMWHLCKQTPAPDVVADKMSDLTKYKEAVATGARIGGLLATDAECRAKRILDWIENEQSNVILVPEDRDLLRDIVSGRILLLAAPIDMVLHCPYCHEQHIDKAGPPTYMGREITVSEYNGLLREAAVGGVMGVSGLKAEWKNPPHKSHLCAFCGCIWRPADVCTNGVADARTKGEADNWQDRELGRDHTGATVR